MHIFPVALVSRGNEKEKEIQMLEHYGWYEFSESMKDGLFFNGPANDHDRLRFRALGEDDRAEANSRAMSIWDAGGLTVAGVWRTALNEVFAAKGVVMKLRRRPRGLCDPLLVPSPAATQVYETCGQPVANSHATV